MTDGVSEIVDAYRPLYRAEDVSGPGEAKVGMTWISCGPVRW